MYELIESGNDAYQYHACQYSNDATVQCLDASRDKGHTLLNGILGNMSAMIFVKVKDVVLFLELNKFF